MVDTKSIPECSLEPIDEQSCRSSRGIFSSSAAAPAAAAATNFSSAESLSSSATAVATVDVHGSLYPSCYCYSLMLSNIERLGFLRGFRESVKTDSDRCTLIFRIHMTKPLIEVAKSLTTSLTAVALTHPKAMPRLVEMEGHTHGKNFLHRVALSK
jgi:hypothetical protein